MSVLAELATGYLGLDGIRQSHSEIACTPEIVYNVIVP